MLRLGRSLWVGARRQTPPTATTVIVGAVLILAATAVGAFAQPPTVDGALPPPLPILPSDNWWNADVSQAPLDPISYGVFRM